MKVKFLNLNDLKVSEQDLDIVAENLSDNHDLIASVLKWQLANRRGFSTAKTKTIDEIAAWAEENKLKLHHWVLTTDLTHLIKGGRVSKVSVARAA